MAVQVTFTARSGSVTTGGTSQQLAPALATRQYLLIQNPAAAAGPDVATAESLFVRFGAAAGVNNGTSFEILPGGSLELAHAVSIQEVLVVAATTARRWIAVEA